jgi:aminoglycoside 6'-N-acetyltransferase I
MFTIRQMSALDRAEWVKMRESLWPDESPGLHITEIDRLLQADDAWGFIAESSEGAAAGFAEIVLRKYANGCDSRPVPFLEGIWVDVRFRRQGAGGQLIRYIETFMAARGFCEIGSDTQIDNRISQATHIGWGFSQTERVVYFRKLLPR